MTTVAEKKRSAAAAKQWAEKARKLGTLLNLHIAGVALLGLVNLYLLAQMAFAWRAASSENAAAIADQTVAMKTAEIARQPLEGLDEKLAQATKDSDRFYKLRLPFATSEVAGELTEAKMDASLSGDYRPLVLFINALERDKMFFLINGVTLTGQQSGTVGLRLRLTTYLRSPVGVESSEKTVSTEKDASDGTPADATSGGRR
jgi:type IV pilus assembly protein PilO